MLLEQQTKFLNKLRPENKGYDQLSISQLASFYWQLTDKLQNERVGKEFLYETVKQFQILMKRVIANPMMHDPDLQARMFDEIRMVGEQTSETLAPYTIASKMELLSERVGFKRICWSHGISIGIPKLFQQVDCGIDWQHIGNKPNSYVHVMTLNGTTVADEILRSSRPLVTISSSLDENIAHLSCYGRFTPSRGITKFWRTSWDQGGSLIENKAVLTVPYIYDDYGMIKPEYEEFGDAIVDTMSSHFL